MIFLKILAAIALFFVVLFSLNLKLDIAMYDTLTLRAGLGPVMRTLSPKKKRNINPDDFSYKKHQKRLKRARKQAWKKAEKKQRRAEQKAAEKTGAAEALTEAEKNNFPLGFIVSLLEFIFHELGSFFGYFHAEIVTLDITVGGKDAASVGKNYGIISQLVEYLLELLDYKTHLKKLRDGSVAVKADFLLEKTTCNIHIILKFRLFSIVKVGCHALAWFIKQKIKEAKNTLLPSPKKDEQTVQS